MTVSITIELAKLEAATRPQGLGNTEAGVHEYWFWKQVESAARSKVKESLAHVQSIIPTAEETTSIVVGPCYDASLAVVHSNVFDKQVFMENVSQELDIPKHRLVEIAEKSSKTQVRRTYKAVRKVG